jgi:putative oxidoreductase
MKIATTIARYLLGFIFTVFGLNGFFHFIPQPPVAEPLAIQYMTVMAVTHYFVSVFLIQLMAGISLLLNRFVPLAVALLAPVIVNILLFHSLMNPEGIGAGLLVTVLWVVVFLSVRGAFAGLFRMTPLGEAKTGIDLHATQHS